MAPRAAFLKVLNLCLVAAALAAVVAGIGVTASALAAADRDRSTQKLWAQWKRHLAAVRPDVDEARQLAAKLQQVAGPRAHVALVGSAATGALQPTSDVDIKVIAASCADYASLGAELQGLGFVHAFSGGNYALFSGTAPVGKRAVDVSLSVEQDDVLGKKPDEVRDADAARRVEARGFLEWLVRRNHPDVTIRH